MCCVFATSTIMQAMLPQGTPPPVEGRLHIEIQTDEYTEDLASHCPTEKSIEIQTDDVPARPLSPLFIPAKIGVDAVQQTENNNDDTSSTLRLAVDHEVISIMDSLATPIKLRSAALHDQLQNVHTESRRNEMAANVEMPGPC